VLLPLHHSEGLICPPLLPREGWLVKGGGGGGGGGGGAISFSALL